jgi:O-antigen/teichoic acid export membrane protein
MVSVVASLSTVLLTFGTPQILIRAIRRNVDVSQAIFSCVRMVILCSAVGVFALLIATEFLGDERKWSGLQDYTAWVSIWFTTSAMCLIMASALQAMDDFRSAVLVGARNGGLIPNVCFFLIILVGSQFELVSLGNVLAIRAILQVMVLLLAIRFVVRGSRRHRVQTSQTEPEQEEDSEPTVRWFFRESWYTVITQLVVVGMAEFDVLLVGSYVNDDSAADYGAAKTLIAVVKSPLLIAQNLVGPFIAELYYISQTARLEKLLRGVATLIGVPAVLALAIFICFPEMLLSLTYGDGYQGTIPLLRILAIGQLVAVLTGCKGLTLIMTGHQRELMGCSLLILIAYVILAPWAISQWGVLGGAWLNTTLVTILNILITIVVRIKVKIWVTPSFSLSALKYGLSSFRRKQAAASPKIDSPESGSV